MAGDKFDQLYNALKADGAVSGTREHFRQFVYAPGKQGYHNRKQLYDALHADGAVSSKSYEEFAQRLGLHAVNPKHQQKAVAQQKPMTTSQRAQKVAAQYQQTKPFEQPKYQQIKPLAQNKPQQPVDYLHRPQNQMGRARRNAPGKASPFVQSLYEIDNAQKGPDYSVDYTSPKATQQVYQHNQQVRRQAAKTAGDHIVNDEYRRQSQPMIDNGTVGVMKPMGEIEQEMSDSASKFVDANLGDYINKAVLGEQNAAAQRGLDAANRVPLQAGAGGGMGLMVKGMAYNKEVDPDAMAKNLTDNARNGFLKQFKNPSFVAKLDNEADRLGVTPEAYTEYIIQHLKDRLAATLQQSEYQKALPKNMLDNVANRFIDSNLTGQLLRIATQTRGQRVMHERASAATASGENPYYKGSTAENVTADIAGFVADPIFGASAKFGGFVAGKLIGNSTKIGTLMANGNLLQRLTLQGTQAVTSGGVTGFVFDSTGSVIQNYSTGEDTSLGNTLSVAAKGGATGAANFATMSLASVPLSQLGRSIGLKGVEGGSFWGNTGRATAKVVLETGKTYMEAMGMYLGGYVAGKIEGHTDANGNPVKFDLWNGTIESLPTAIGFRIQHAIGGLKGGRKNEKGEDMGWAASTLANFREFLTSDKAKVSKFMMSEEEKKQIMDSFNDTNAATLFHNVYGAAKNSKTRLKTTDGIFEKPYVPEPTKYEDVERDLEGVRTVYDKIMADPNVSWDAKAKFSAMVMGIMPSARPKMDFVGFSTGYVDYVQHKYVDEYSDKGELLSRREYKNISEREAVIYKLKANAENVRLRNAVALVAGIDKNNYELQNAFFQMKVNRGANANDVIEGLKTPGSEIDKEFSEYAMNMGNVNRSLEFVADNFNKSVDWVLDAFEKDPMYRNDDQQKAAVLLRRSLENTAFPNGKVHEEQSNLNGKDVAEDNNLGTEQPNGDAVKQELNGLRQAEEEVEVLMRDNDVFSQNFKKLQSQGLTNPQIYDWMVQQGGLTVEQLEPFAHYINANARVQGMQEATKQKIEETVSVFAQDWSYHGTLNGQPMNGEQALYVQDSNGRTLLVGSGDVAFDQTTGRAKEGSGDMLVCFDPNTNEMVYVKADEVTLLQNQPIDQFAAEYRQRLQMKNSEPYNQAAQEQAMQDAAENQDQSESGKGNDASETPEIVSEATPVETPTDFSFNNGKGRINSYKATPHEKTKSDGTKEITFSSEVTFTKGAPKGRKEGEVINIGNGGGFIKIDPIDIDYQQYAVSGRLHDDGTAFSKDEATSEDIAEAKEQIDTLLTPQLAEEMGPQYNVKKIIIAPDGRVFAKFIGMDGNIPLKRNPLEKAPQDDTTKSEDSTTKEGNLIKDDTNLTKDNTTLTKVDTTSGEDNTTNEDNLHGKYSDIIREFDTKRGKHVVVRKVYSENDKLKVTKIEAKADDGTGVSSVYEYFPLPDEYEIRPIDIEAMEEGGTKVLGVNELRENKRGTYADGTDLTDAGAKVVVKFEDGSIGSIDVGLIRKNVKPAEQPHPSRKFADGTEVPMTTDSKGRPTPDYASMTPEQSAEILTEDFGENAEKVVDGQIQKAEKALKDAEKMKVDYTAEPNDIMEQEALKKKTVEAAKKQLEHAQNIKKVMTAKKVAETVGKTEQTEGAHEAGSVAEQKFVNAPRLVGNKRTRMLPDGETKIKGHYEIVPAEGLTPSHDVNNGYKKSEGFPTDAEGRTVNDRDYEHDKAAQQNTDQIARKYNGMAIEQVPVVSDEGIVYDGNGRTMAGQKAAKDGTDGEYINDLLENAENFGFTREQIEQSGIEHPRLVLVTDERLPYDTATFAKFNRNEKKTQSNTEQAVAKAKTLTSDEVGAIVAEIEGNGSLEAFFNNSKAINDLVKTLVDKGIIGQNEVAQMMDSPERLSAQGREYVKNLLLGSIFKPETIRMLGIDSTVKNKAINAIRSVMDNMKLGEFSLRDEIDQAIQLLYEARQGGNKVDTLLRTPSMFGEDAAKRYPSISQMMALALEGKVADFRDLLDEYNRIAAARNTGEGNVFGEAPTKPELIKEFLDFKKWQDYGTGHSENEGGNDVSGVEEPQQEASGGNEPAEAGEGRVKSEDEDKPNSVGFTPKEIKDHQEKLGRAKEKYIKALSEAKSEKEIKAAEDEFEFTYKDHQNMNGVLDEASVADMWKKELESAKDSVKKDSKKLSADPMEALENAADAFHEEQKQKTEFKRNLEIGKARQEYEEAKKKGNANEISHAAGKLRNLLNEKYKAQGMGFEQRRKKIAEEIGKAEAEIIDKPWEQMDLEEREAVSSKNPLTESEINELTSEENKELIPAALAYLRGDKGNIINAISYFKIWNDVRNRHENVSGNSGTENGTQLDAADTTGGEGLGLGRGRESGRPDGPVDRGAGNEAAPGERNGREGDQNDTTLSAGEQGNKQGEGNSSGMGAVPAGSSDTNGGGSASGNGHVSGGSGRESSKRPADTNAGRKPTAKQGTTFPDSTAERLKQERADYEKKKKDFWARWKKAGQGYAKIALTPFKKLNLTPEQIEMLPELFKMHLNGAVLKIKEGIYKFNEWKAAMLAEEGEELKMIGLSDDDIDRFIEDYWNTPYEMDGETHTIREWSSIYGNQQLKKKLKEPLEEKYKRQMEAEPIEVKVGDMKNIEETLPYLLPQQQEDVLKAETQFFGKEHTDREHAYGKGYLFTNGTGTGKTYTGLGIAKRLAKQGKGRILFITPSQKKVSDWIKDGKNLGLDIKDLDSLAKERGTTATTESGEGMVITTFANFGLNKKLLETEWDAVIYDECHRIMENKKGTETARSMQHYMVTNRDENHCFQRLQSINPEYQKMNGAAEKFDALRLKEIDRIKKEYKNSHPSATNRDVDNATLKSLPRDLNSFAPADGMTFPKLGKAYQDFIKARDAYNKVEPKLKEQAKDSWKNTKTIFLSATPFNTRENLDYVEGYIFKYPETDERGMGGRTQFYLNHFGAAYKFRYHRLEQSISNPDAVAKQEVAFSDYLQNTLGTMSGRIIDSPYDYSRDFPTVAPDHAEDFNNAVQDTLKTKYLHDAYSKTIGDYNYGSALFETMKVSAAIDRIKQHLGLGRKVVIFHRRVESKEPLEAPFAYMLRVANEQIKMMKPGKERDEYIKECTEFRNKYADLLEWEKTLDYSMPREQIAKVFGEKNVLFFSGKESKKVKDKAIDTFNDDDSGKNIIVIQEASGKEGISLHDTTSKHQRVCITLALPQSPITALQIEGRIYRIGNMSNAIFEYPILGLNSEMMLFGEKFNNQVSTTENLALGSQARNLRDSFAKGILEHSGIVPVENQGVGGKEFDAATPSENDPFDNAVLDYYSNQKLNKNNREGSDYFPTPEPLGYKMVEWAGLGEGDSVLEPSAGHGAIARYVPKTNEMVSIEPSQSLFTKLQLRAGGLGRKFMNNTFENYSLNNKHDVIVMNPPFGKAGALAIQHVDKAFKHLDEGGRIVAIIPRGSTDKKFDKWYNEQKNVAMRAEVNLPDILFQQAGTRVACRVVVLDKISDAALRSKAGYPEKIDLSGHYDKIEDFFNDLRDIEMPERIIDTNLKMQKKAKAAVKDIMEIKGVKNVSYGKTGIDVSLTGSWMNYGISFTGSDKPNYWRDKMANYYNKYDELQKLEYQENKQSVFDELKKLSCKLAGMTEDEMQRYIASKSNGGTHFREDHGDGNYPASSVESHVEKVAKKTGAKVNMVSSFDEITNKAAKAAVEEGRKITGWYDEKTGEVHLYMPNIHDRYTAEKTIWHEVVGHKGMRELFGEDRFNQFLRDVWYDLDKPENAELKKLVDEERKFNPLNIYDAIEEGIARLAEDGKGEPGFWNGIKNKVSDFLHEIGYRIAPNTKDVKYLLWLSKNLQKNPNDPYWKLRAEAVKYRLDHERVPAVVAHDGMFYGNDGKVRSMESMTKSEWNDATDGQIHFRTTPSAGTALDRYHRSLDEHGYMFTESYMDSMLSLKKLMNAIVPDKKIEDIASSENPYMLQNTMQGAMSNAAQMFERNVMKPLDKAMAGVLDAFDGKKDDEKIRNFNLYMITKHGLERNRVFFVRDFLRQMRMDEQKKQDADILENRWGNEKERLDNELNAGNIDLKEYYRQMDEFISNEIDPDYKAGEHDYSGIHAIQEVAKSSDPYDDAEAIQSVMDSEAKMESIKKGAVKDYWDKVKAAAQYSIDSDYKNNIIDKELHDYVSNMFNWYVPLRKYDEATAEDTYGYITELGDPKNYIGSTIMRARGHKYLSETNVLAQIGAMGNRAIKNGGLNAIKMAFARFARNNSNNNLITEVSVWYEKDPMTGIVYERYPDIPEDATPDEINQIVADFNTDMKAKAAQGLASKVYRRGSIGYKFQRAENKSQHIVDVKIAGRTHSFIINGNPRAAQALNGLLEHKNDTLAGRVAASISRNMAQLCTSYNPEFVMRNMIKDFEYASTNLLAKEGFRYTKLFEQYYAKVGIIEGIRNSKLKDLADTGGFGLFAKYRNGTLDTNDKVQRYFKEFMENGGETGWVQIKNMKDWTKEYKLHVKGERNKVQKVGKGFYNAIFKNLENINEIAENLARFSTYCASRDYGRSVIRSVYDAKVVSTNFNRHGSGNAIYSFKNGEMGAFKTARKNIYGFTASWFRNSSMFFNAGIQSTNLLIKNFKNNKAGTIGYIASAPFISGMAMALLNNFIISNEDEKDRNGVKDPYGELPDYIRRNNLCVYIGGGEFVTIPLAIEERAFYGLGDLAAGMTFSKNISSQKMPNLTENKDIDKYLNPFMDAVGCMSQLVPVADYLGNSSFGKHPWQETKKALAPSATSPFLEWLYNSDWKGAPIQRDNKFDENQPSWMLAYKGTPEWMINMNKKVNALTNDVAPGNEDMKGNDFLDAVTNPSALHHFYGSYFGGAATFLERVGGLIKNGKDTETKDIPFLRSLLYTPSEQSSLQRTKSKWYNYKDEMEKTMANVDRLKSKNVPLDKRITNIGEYYHFQNSKEAAKVRVIELAEKQMDRWKKMRDKASDTESINFANQNIDRIMMDAVDDLDKLN